jgi:phage terminase large subunit-like protein
MARTATASYVLEAERYVRDVLNGKIPACKWVRLACERHRRDVERFKGRNSAYYFDHDAANNVCEILEHFRHVKGIWARAGQYLTLEPWQIFIVTSVFGWKRRSDGARRFRIVYAEVPRKNAKSTTTSAVGNYLLACDGEQGSYVVSAATTREQARIVFTDAQTMARREPDYLSEFGVEVHAHSISQPGTNSKFEPLAAEDNSLDGLNIHGALIDELHAHKSRGVWDVLETATGSRFQPLIWAITTAGTNRASVCYEQHLHVKEILNGTREDESYFGIIYTVDEDDDPFEESSWIKANPNYGVSIYPENFREIAARAQTMPSAQTAFFTKHLNIWVNADHSWLDIRAWAKLTDPKLDLEQLAGEVCYVGVDLALRSDIAAVVLVFPPTKTRAKWAVFGRYYLPEEQVEKSENAHYQGWERAGLLTATPGSVTDFEYILDDLITYLDEFQIREVASDPWKNIPLVNALQNRGVTVPIVNVRQTMATMSPAMKELEALVVGGEMVHNGDPILAWMVANVVVHRDAKDNIYPRKDSNEKKIDGVLALLMALDRAQRQEQTPDFAARGLWSI